MVENRISSASESNVTITEYTVDSAVTDAASGNGETRWTNTNWTKYYGYYKKIAELAAAINAKATWTVGKGVKTTPRIRFILDQIKGWGKDTFNTIIENMIRTYYIGGDAYAEIIRDEEKNLVNLKPLPPESITIVANNKGIIKHYEQISKTPGEKNRIIKTEEMFHLARNRVADEIHGTSVIDSVENIILARNESITDYRQMIHEHMKPRYIFHLETDDTTEIAAFKAKMDDAIQDGKNIYIPKDSVVPEVMSIAPNSTLDPKGWINDQGDYFYEAVGTPQIIMGGSGEFTEASAKIAYLAWEQNVEEEQLFIEEQVGMQLGIAIELEFPASLENELLSDKSKDGAIGINQNETTAGSGQ